MTTIALRDGVMASDTRMMRGQCIVGNNAQKIWRTSFGIVGICGEFADSYQVEKLGDLSLVPDLKRNENTSFLVLYNDGQIIIIEGNGYHHIREPFCAIGSGGEAARAAMHMGADAVQAVEIAMLLDPATGGQVRVEKLNGNL